MDEHTKGRAPGTIAPRFYLGREVGWWWAAAAMGGALLISLTTGVSVIRLALPVAVMVFYAAAAYRLPNVDVPKLADSVYFMGFLWTLWALIDTTVIKHEVSQGSIFRVFGYALVTTTIGMFLRLFLVQFHYSVDDQAAEAREELDIVVARLRTQLEASEQSLKTFASSNRLLTVSLVNRVMTVEIVSTNEALLTKLRQFGASNAAVGASLSKTTDIEALLGAVEIYHGTADKRQGEPPDCRLDYGMRYATPADYQQARQTFESGRRFYLTGGDRNVVRR
jgi:hypothetical protein